MRNAALALACSLMAATPVLAQDGGNVGQPSRTAPQAGQTTGGPRDTDAMSGGAATTGTVSRPAGEMGMSPGAGAVGSAKGGNADQTNKMAPNASGTAGGPAR